MNVLVFSTHSADFCSRAGGTIAKLVQQGARVRVVALSYGERSESGGLYADGAHPSLEEVKAIRHEEATRAAEILGAEIAFLDWGDLGFEDTRAKAQELAVEIRAFQPQAVLTHHGPDVISVDHDTTYKLVLHATQMAGAPGLETETQPWRRPPLFLFEATIPLTEVEGFTPDFYIDITDVWETKVAALEAFGRAQGFLLGWYTDVARNRAFQACRLAGRDDIRYAEAFRRTLPWVGDTLPMNGRE